MAVTPTNNTPNPTKIAIFNIPVSRERSGARSSMGFLLLPAHPASATHSISQPLPKRSCIDQTVRAGGSTGKNSR